MLNPISLDYLQSEINTVLSESIHSLPQKVHTLALRMMDELSLEDVLSLEGLLHSHKRVDSYYELFTSGAIEALITEVKKAKIIRGAKLPPPLKAPLPLEEQPTIVLTKKSVARSTPAEDDPLQGRVLRRRPRNSPPATKSFAYSNISILSSIYSEKKTKLLENYQIDKACEGFYNILLILSELQQDSQEKETKVSLHRRLTAAKESLKVEEVKYNKALKTECAPFFLMALKSKQAVMQQILSRIKTLDESDVLFQENIVKEASEDLMKALLVASGVPQSELNDEMPDECKIT